MTEETFPLQSLQYTIDNNGDISSNSHVHDNSTQSSDQCEITANDQDGETRDTHHGREEQPDSFIPDISAYSEHDDRTVNTCENSLLGQTNEQGITRTEQAEEEEYTCASNELQSEAFIHTCSTYIDQAEGDVNTCESILFGQSDDHGVQERTLTNHTETTMNSCEKIIENPDTFIQHSGKCNEHADRTESKHENSDCQSGVPVLQESICDEIEQADVQVYKNESNEGQPYCLKQHNAAHGGYTDVISNTCENGVRKPVYFILKKRTRSQQKKSHSNDKKPKRGKLFKCDLCNFSSRFSNNIIHHKKTHTEETLNHEFGDLTAKCSNELSTHKMTNAGEIPLNFSNSGIEQCPSKRNIRKRNCKRKTPFVCEDCDFRTWRTDDFTNHRRIHTGEKHLTCNLCDYSTRWPTSLSIHKRKHTGVKPFMCDLCDYRAISSRSLRTHKKIHGIGREPKEEKLHICDVCGLRLSRKDHLKDHKKLHGGENLLMCEVCGYGTRFARKLTIHKRLHSGEKPYTCDACDYRTHDPGCLKRHKRTHYDKDSEEAKPFICDICGVRKRRSDDLTEHKRIHTGEKPFTCEFCNFRTSWSHSLTVHKRQHTGEKPFKCDLCTFSARQSASLTKHKRTHLK